MSDSIWFNLRGRLQDELPDEDYNTWIRPLKVRSEDAKKLVLLAPNDRFLRALEESFRPQVDRAVAGMLGGSFEVLFALESEAEASREETFTSSPTLAPSDDSRFNSRYHFDSFVVGSSNQFAHAAARAISERPGESYNPLFLYGGVGLGKTHLLHAVGHHIQRSFPERRLASLTAEQFLNDLIHSLRFDKMSNFRSRHREIDVLLVDDIQFLSNKERTQEEFFHTFNTLYTEGKQIVLSSDAPPKDIPELEERLRSRFEWGLIADIQPPDLETKVAILRRKADLQSIPLDDEVALFIARQVRSNIRELEGHLNRVVAYASLTGRPLGIDLVRETLKDVISAEDQPVSAAAVIKIAAQHYGLKVREIKSRNNSRQISFPRQVAMYLLKQLTPLSYPEIGKQFNDKHHSTVMYAVEKIEKLQREDEALRRVLDDLSRQIR